MGKIKYYTIALFLLLFLYHIISVNYPLNKKPTNYLLARFLATTVINESGCSNLESMGKVNNEVFLFSCEKYGLELEGSYTIYIFPNVSVRNIFLKKIGKENTIFKYGRYFIIKENIFYGSSKYNTPKEITVDSYKGFMGDLN